MRLQRGAKLGSYEIDELLGRGGMGEVYRASQSQSGTLVAVKVLTGDLARSEEARRRFDREISAIGSISHPNTPAILHSGMTDDGTPFYVTELLEGRTLREELHGSALSWPESAAMTREVAAGLGAAHDRGIVHLDLKPENIFLLDAGGLKILDFGLACMSAEASKNISSNAGTAAYMAPELLRGERPTPAADLFSLGCVLFESVTGSHPFRRGSSLETIAAILDDDLSPAHVRSADAPEGLDAFLMRCLAKDPSERIRSTEQFLLELDGV